MNEREDPPSRLRRGLVAVAGGFMLAASCAPVARPVRAPVSFPFAVAKAGSKLAFDLLVAWEDSFQFYLRFSYPPEDAAERQRLRRLMGNSGRRADGTFVDTGVPVSLRLSVRRDPPAREAYPFDKVLVPELSGSGVDHFHKTAAYRRLVAGIYRVEVESLADAPELAAVPTVFSVGMPKG